jgi:alpha-mannosidase
LIRHLEYTRARLARTSERLRTRIYPETRPLDELVVAGPVDRIPRDEALGLEYRPAAHGERFGPLWATYWFRANGTVPAAWAGRRVDLLWDSNSEATLWLDGVAAQGLNRHHRDAVVAERAEAEARLAFEVELACNGLFGEQDAPVELHRFELAVFDPDAWSSTSTSRRCASSSEPTGSTRASPVPCARSSIASATSGPTREGASS